MKGEADADKLGLVEEDAPPPPGIKGAAFAFLPGMKGVASAFMDIFSFLRCGMTLKIFDVFP